MTRYPLTWPEGWPRVPAARRIRARFSKGERKYSDQSGSSSWMQHRQLTINDGVQRCLRELQSLGVLEGDSIISTNLRVRLDGLPRSDQREPEDPGVAVYWERPGDKAPRVMAIDIYDRVADNLAAIAATLEAMRAIERHGGAQILERAFTGFTALPAPGATTTPWRTLFGDVGTRAELDTRYRQLRSQHHPDKGGDSAMFNTVQKSYEQACQDICS